MHMSVNINSTQNIFADFDQKPSLRIRVNFLVSQKCLVKYGTKNFYENLNLLVYWEIFQIYFMASLIIDIKE